MDGASGSPQKGARDDGDREVRPPPRAHAPSFNPTLFASCFVFRLPPPPCYSLAAIVSLDLMVVNFLFVLLFV